MFRTIQKASVRGNPRCAAQLRAAANTQQATVGTKAAVRPFTVTAAAVLCISSLNSGPALLSVKVACTLATAATAIAELVYIDSTAELMQQPSSPSTATNHTGSSSSTTTTTSSNSHGHAVLPSIKQLAGQTISHHLFLPSVAGTVCAAILSAALPAEVLPAPASLCLLAFLYQRQQEVASLQQQVAAAQCSVTQELQEQQELQQQQLQQLQRQASKVQAQSMKVEQLQCELKQARKASEKLDRLQHQFEQQAAEKQDLQLKLLLMEQQLQSTQEQLDAAQAAAKAAASTASSNLIQSMEQGSNSSSHTSSQEGTSAAISASRRVVAFVGGRQMKESDRKLFPRDVDEIRFFGSAKDAGSGDIKRLEAAIKAGSIHEVYMLTRWNGHGHTKQITRLCKERGIPCRLLDSGGKARLKAEWEEASTDEAADI